MARKLNSSRVIIALLMIVIAVAVYFYRQKFQRTPEPVPGPVTGKLTVRFLDIGQGDAELIQLPSGETIIIDSGDRGAATVDMLKKYGVSEIDLLIATHPHADHIGEMRDIMRAFKVKELWDSGFPHTTTTYANMLEERKSRGIKFLKPKRGETRKIGDALLEVLNPSNDLPDDNANNASLVVRLTFGSTRFLFTGDSEKESWQQMIASEKDKLRADLLKSAHHGSENANNEDILDAVNPSIVTISCAQGNDYHHPHPKVMRLLRERESIRLYRTDMEGTITATSDGKTIEVTTEKRAAKADIYLTGDELAERTGAKSDSKKKTAARRGM
ncbi:MAG: ComEC/Rec2 family competence protein [Acidobacteriota bacterium]